MLLLEIFVFTDCFVYIFCSLCEWNTKLAKIFFCFFIPPELVS